MTVRGPYGNSVTVAAIIPAKNEALNLVHVLPKIPSLVDELILVDGHSTDNTAEIAKVLAPSIQIVTQPGKGKGDALRAGFRVATSDIIVMLDADGSTDPAEIPAFVDALVSGAEFVKGSRFIKGGGTADMSLLRQLGNWGFTNLVKYFFAGNYTDLCYGYNACWRRSLPQHALDGDGFEIETVMNIRVLRAGLRVVEVPSFEAQRIHGESHLRTFPDGWRVLTVIGREAADAWAIAPSLAGQAAEPVLTDKESPTGTSARGWQPLEP